MLFTNLVSSRIIFRDIVSIFLGAQSKDIILIFSKENFFFAKRFFPYPCVSMSQVKSLLFTKTPTFSLI